MNNELIYLDTNIYMDYFLIREDKLRPLSDFAFELIRRAISCEFKIAVSDLIIMELEKSIPRNSIQSVLLDLEEEDKLVTLNKTKETEKKAREITKQYGVHFNDALHYVLALETKSVYLVTRDEHFWELPQNDILIRKPENI